MLFKQSNSHLIFFVKVILLETHRWQGKQKSHKKNMMHDTKQRHKIFMTDASTTCMQSLHFDNEKKYIS